MEEITPEIHFHLPAFIPEAYVEDPGERLSLYRRLSLSRSDEEVETIREELVDRFGKIPLEGGASPGSDQGENSSDPIVH